jgi:hypothetical protein
MRVNTGIISDPLGAPAALRGHVRVCGTSAFSSEAST